MEEPHAEVSIGPKGNRSKALSRGQRRLERERRRKQARVHTHIYVCCVCVWILIALDYTQISEISLYIKA